MSKLSLAGFAVGIAVALTACSAEPAASPAPVSPTPFTVTDAADASAWTSALEGGDTEALASLVDSAGPDAIIDGRTALQVAAGAGNVDAIELLVAAGADLDARAALEQEGGTALHFAANSNCAECVDVLVAAGADPLRRDRYYPQRAPIHVAASVGAMDALAALLGSGIDIDTPDGAGGHALLWSALYNQTEVAIYLLEHGSDPTIIDGSRYNASQRAAGAGHEELAALLADAAEEWTASH